MTWIKGECAHHGPILLWKGSSCPVCRANARTGMAQATRLREAQRAAASRDAGMLPNRLHDGVLQIWADRGWFSRCNITVPVPPKAPPDGTVVHVQRWADGKWQSVWNSSDGWEAPRD